jgi:hypothetical protein
VALLVLCLRSFQSGCIVVVTKDGKQLGRI